MERERKSSDLVMEYYAYADQGDIPNPLGLFSKDAIHTRCESEIKGRKALADFYTKERRLVGVHTIEEMISYDNQVIVRGVFKGKNGRGKDVVLRFVDFFTFGDKGKIIERFTYLAIGYDLAK